MIQIQGLQKVYKGGTIALHNLDLTIDSGMFGLLGPNGAGKTSLMRIIAGLQSPTSGHVMIFGKDITTAQGKAATKSILGYLPQDLGLYPNLTGREFLDYVGILKGVSSRKVRQYQVEELLELVRLSDNANKKLKTYSGGMKRRIGIAQALMGTPKLLIVDEPTVGLDPEERVRLRNLLSDMATRCTVILSTHIIEDITHSCRDLAVIKAGELIFQGSPKDLIEQADGYAWTVVTQRELLQSDLYITSTIQQADGIHYRVLGTPPPNFNAIPRTPNLEDGYIWLMNGLKQTMVYRPDLQQYANYRRDS